MKCPRCGREMKKQRTKEHTFQFVCPVCGLRIGSNRQNDTGPTLDASQARPEE